MEEGRLGRVVSRLTSDLHQAIADLGGTEEEFWIGLRYLNEVGRAGEFPPLSDVLEVSILVDGITNGTDADSTASNVEGPFCRPVPVRVENSDPQGCESTGAAHSSNSSSSSGD